MEDEKILKDESMRKLSSIWVRLLIFKRLIFTLRFELRRKMLKKWCKKEVKKPDENRKNEREMVFLKGL